MVTQTQNTELISYVSHIHPIMFFRMEINPEPSLTGRATFFLFGSNAFRIKLIGKASSDLWYFDHVLLKTSALKEDDFK